MEVKNLKIETIERVKGHTLCSYWNNDMFVVNGKYVSSVYEPDHNINKKPFDLEVGENVEVVTNPHKASGTVWIARKT
jgi:hypothetical protein